MIKHTTVTHHSWRREREREGRTTYSSNVKNRKKSSILRECKTAKQNGLLLHWGELKCMTKICYFTDLLS